jgi:hypothetical protein
MANKVQTPVQNYFEKVLYENLTFEIPPLWFLRVVSRGIKKIVTSRCGQIRNTDLKSTAFLKPRYGFIFIGW